MALSMLGLRTRAFTRCEPKLSVAELLAIGEVFDAVVDPPLDQDALGAVIGRTDARFVVEAGAAGPNGPWSELLPPRRTAVVDPSVPLWDPICRILGLTIPAEAYPAGTPAGTGMFRDERANPPRWIAPMETTETMPMDDSPWVMPITADWRPRPVELPKEPGMSGKACGLAEPCLPELVTMIETFPGNLAVFARDGVVEVPEGKRLVLSVAAGEGVRPLQSGAIASARAFHYGRFEAEIRAANGAGLVTGFFLHRDTPRQEIDIELTGDNPRQMLVNVYFNPGDDGAAIGFGYRGSPSRINLGFDASADFHTYAIDWLPDRILWSVDGVTVHERRSWDPTPIPHLPMRLHGNLWAPRSVELAGRLDWNALPASAEFRKVEFLAEEGR